eukprot:gene20414-7414_t
MVLSKLDDVAEFESRSKAKDVQPEAFDTVFRTLSHHEDWVTDMVLISEL